MSIRQLKIDDWKIWKEIRLRALKDFPEAFGSSYEEELKFSEARFKEGLIKSDIFGSFESGNLIGVAGFFSLTNLKTKHRGVLFGLYVEKDFRGKGVASELILTVINHAKTRVSQLHLSVVTTNQQAVGLYQKFGFRIYGTEPKALKIQGQFYDEFLMVLDWQ